VLLTVETPDDWFFMIPLFQHYLDVRVLLGERDQGLVEISPDIGRGRPSIAILEHEFSDLWNK